MRSIGSGFDGYEDLDKQYVALLTAENGKPFTYYNGGAWNKAGKITSTNEWFAYLNTFRDKLAAPLRAEIR